MRLLLIGAGAVGTWIGVNLMRAGNEVVFVARPAFAAAARAHGLSAMLPRGGKIHLPGARVEPSAAAAVSREPFDATVLCMKAYSLAAALAEVAPFADSLGQFVCFQNGVGSEEAAAAMFGAGRVTAATLTSPVSQLAPAHVALDRLGGGIGLADVEARSGFAGRLANAASTELMPARTYADYRSMKWSKMLLNIVGNASSAIHDKDVAEIYADRALFAEEMSILRECLAVMRAQKIPVIDLPGYSARAFARVVAHTPNWLAQSLLLGRVSRGRGGKRPSFYYDVANKTGRSEVGNLNGQIAAHGRRLGVPTPVNERLTRALLALVETAQRNVAG